MIMKIKETFSKILQTTEKYTGLDNTYFLKNSLFSFIQQSIGLVSGLAISYMFGHYASKSLFGQYNFILSFISLLTIFTLQGLDNALITAVAKGFDGSFQQAVKLKIRCSILAIPIFIGLAIYYLLTKQTNISISLLVASFFFPFLFSFNLFSAFLTAKRKFKTLALFLSLSSILTATAVSLSIFFTESLLIIIIAYIIGILIPSFYAYKYSFRFVKNNRHDPKLFSYSLFLSSVSILPWTSGYLGQILLGALLGFESLATYSAASRFPLNVHKNIFVFYKPVTAKLASQNNKEHLETLTKHWWKLLLWGFILCAFLWLILPFLVNFLFTNTYADSIKYARYLSLGLIPLPLTWVISDILLYQQKKKAQITLFTIPPIIKLILFIILIPFYGINGLVFITVFDRFFMLILAIIIIRNKNLTI